MTEPDEEVLEHFEAEVAERNAVWRAPTGTVPRMEVRHHRDASITRVMVRSDGRQVERDDTLVRIKGVTVHFTDAEWALVERAVLAGLGLSRVSDG